MTTPHRFRFFFSNTEISQQMAESLLQSAAGQATVYRENGHCWADWQMACPSQCLRQAVKDALAVCVAAGFRVARAIPLRPESSVQSQPAAAPVLPPLDSRLSTLDS